MALAIVIAVQGCGAVEQVASPEVVKGIGAGGGVMLVMICMADTTRAFVEETYVEVRAARKNCDWKRIFEKASWIENSAG